MSNTATMNPPTNDNESIFSEFYDPQRIALVRDLLQKMNLTHIPRGNLFQFWFCDKEELIRMSEVPMGPRSSPNWGVRFRSRLLGTLSLDVPGYCELLEIAP